MIRQEHSHADIQVNQDRLLDRRRPDPRAVQRTLLVACAGRPLAAAAAIIFIFLQAVPYVAPFVYTIF
jgi:hypothetical protein